MPEPNDLDAAIAALRRYEKNGDIADLLAAIEVSKAAVAAAPKGSKERAALVRWVDSIYERHEKALRSRERPAIAPAMAVPVRVDRAFLAKLRPYVAPPEFLPREAARGAPEILPDIVVAVATDDDGRIDVISRPDEAWLPIAIGNLRRLPFPPVERLDHDTFVLEVEEPFVASRITFLDDLLDGIAPRRPKRHGVLLAIPRRRTMLLHLPNGAEVLAELERMRTVANQVFELTPQSKLSPHVYYVAPDGRRQVVTSPRSDGPFAEMLYGRGGLLV